MTTPAAQSEPVPLPFIEHGQRVVETSFSLSGTIQHPEAQPARAYAMAGEPKVFVVVAFTDGYAVKPADGERTLSWANKFKLAEAFDITNIEEFGDVQDAQGLVEMLRHELRDELGQLATDDPADHTPKAARAS